MISFFKFWYQNAKQVISKDPAIKSLFTALFFVPGVKVKLYHYLAHKLYCRKWTILSDFFYFRSRKITGIEIHPGAKIASDLFIDHGMGIVIGETAIVEENCTIYHGVTLGAKNEISINGRRHPIIHKNVLIGANATILGPITIGEGCKIGANSIVLTSLPPNSVATGIVTKKTIDLKNQ